jgi:glycosyltransferase involved in cell wall biosynthesis
MSLALVCTNADRSGAPNHVLTLVRHFASRIRCFAVFGKYGPICDEVDSLGVPVYVVEGMQSRISPLSDMRSVGSLVRILRRERAELVHLHSAKAGLVGRIAARICGLPVLYTVHGWGFGPGRPPSRSVPMRCVEQVMKPFTSHFLYVSHADRALGEFVLGVPPELSSTVLNGVADDKARATPRDSTTIAMVARVDPAKDHETLVRAVEQMNAPPRIVLIGAGTASREFIHKVTAWAPTANEKIALLDERADVPAQLARAGIFVLMSHFEGLPLSIIEAMRAGLPVVASAVGGVHELVSHGENGFLVQAGDVRTLKNALTRLVGSCELRARMGAASRRIFEEQFSEKRMCAGVERAYGKLCPQLFGQVAPAGTDVAIAA